MFCFDSGDAEKIESNMVKIELGCGFRYLIKAQEY